MSVFAENETHVTDVASCGQDHTNPAQRNLYVVQKACYYIVTKSPLCACPEPSKTALSMHYCFSSHYKATLTSISPCAPLVKSLPTLSYFLLPSLLPSLTLPPSLPPSLTLPPFLPPSLPPSLLPSLPPSLPPGCFPELRS